MNNSDNTNRQDMHTKRSHLLTLRSAAAMLCAAVLLCACSNEIGNDDSGSDGEEAGELTTVTLSVGTAVGEQSPATKGLTDELEKSIITLYILAFQPDKADVLTYKLKYYATGQPAKDGSGNYTFTLRRSVSGAADTKLLLIANQNPYPLVSTGMTYDQVQQALISGELTAVPAFATTGIPMFGFAGNSSTTALEITENMQQPLSANLLRAVARVDVGVGTYNEQTGVWNKGSVGFDLTHVYVFKPQNKYTLLPLINNLEYNVGGTPSVTKASLAGTLSTGNFEYTGAAITNGTYCKAEIYIPEVALNGKQVFDANHENRTALVVGGTYNGKTNYYRIDFTTASSNEGNPYLHDVLRNHIYRYSITSVTLPGYDSPDKAYGGKAVGLSFTPTIVNWATGASASPNPDMLVRMNFKGINGTVITGNEGTISEKGDFVTDAGRVNPPLDYNYLRGEVMDNNYNGSTNGGQYKNVADAFKREGPYAQLIIAPENAGENVQWRSSPKPNRVLDAKKVCWDYRGQGRADWRLPRLSELYLIWLNKATINQSKGFTSLGGSGVTYWSATEGGAAADDKAYAVNASGQISLNAKTSQYSIRCVREVR